MDSNLGGIPIFSMNCNNFLSFYLCLADTSGYDSDYEYTDCAIAMCACDKAGSECFQSTRPTFNEGYQRYDKDSCW